MSDASVLRDVERETSERSPRPAIASKTIGLDRVEARQQVGLTIEENVPALGRFDVLRLPREDVLLAQRVDDSRPCALRTRTSTIACAEYVERWLSIANSSTLGAEPNDDRRQTPGATGRGT